MKQPKRYLITAALPYANGLKHIGHLAGAYLPADIYVRYLRAQKRDVVFVCGSDEHGTAIPIQATKEGTTAQGIIDKYHPIIEQNFNDLGISFDIYHRTSSPIHHETASEFFTALNNKGDLITKESEQYYDEQEQSFLADRYIKGTCPNCGFQAAYGDQCESCGKSLSPDELINPVSTLSGNTPIKKLTKHWYLPLDRHEDFLRKWIIEEHGNDWRSTVVGQCKSWIDGGLQPRAVTRDLDWGVALPDDVEGGKGKVLYVWFDAPIGYISATKQWALNTGKDWRPYWEDQDTKLIHFIGKDNIVFHCIIFPVMLQLHGNILPTNVPANEFMNLEGDKMSTSRNWKLEMEDYINDFIKPENGGSQLADTLRYYLTAIAPESKDSEFTWKGFQDANNSELVSIFGNFINRALVLMHKLCNGKVPPLHNDLFDELDQATIGAIQQSKAKIEQLLEDYKFRDAQFEVINLARIGNQYMQKKEPWILAKQLAENPAAQQLINNCLHICLQLTANLAILSNPFLPFTAKKICYLLKVVDKILDWENAGSMKLLSVGYSLRAPELLFRKIEDEEITQQIEKLKAAAVNKEPIVQTTPVPAVKPEIVFDDFAKIDLKVGTIVAAEKVEKADKLLKLQVDLGFETRTIVSGIAMHFAPEAIVGKQVTVVCNLAPRKMRGIESNGMILMAEDANGKLHFVNPEDAINPGSGVS
ncbi:MAG: methionine--tRNA ligase [Sphingobacteriia bacterium 28-36-52]|nr:MAG: methionine--tRNA ligase [Sphingobacteriia bacterium 28-36-52]